MGLIRREMPKQPAKERRHNFSEVALGYPLETAIEEAGRCLQCSNPTCISGCLLRINIPAFIKCIAEMKFTEGIRILKERNHLPGVCGRVCPAETHCERMCTLEDKSGPIAIGYLERFLADWEASRAVVELAEIHPFTGRRVAVVGGGPAGLTLAGDLNLLGHKVTIFESLDEAGGVLRCGIPEFRLPRFVVKREVEYLIKLGVEIIPDFVVGTMKTIDSLLEEYDALFVATGVGLPWQIAMPGEGLQGIYSAKDYLTQADQIRHQEVGILGGGNIAVDCARTALRLGAEARVFFGKLRPQLKARLEEIENAEAEGVVFEYLTQPIRYIGENGWLTGIEGVRMQLQENGSNGEKTFLALECSEAFFPMDAVVCANGNSHNPLMAAITPGLEMGKKGNILVDPETGKTSKARVWAGGDVTSGAATIILAMESGRRAARSIHQFLCSL
jgi:glutamate synthase (NADPH) small chain